MADLKVRCINIPAETVLQVGKVLWLSITEFIYIYIHNLLVKAIYMIYRPKRRIGGYN